MNDFSFILGALYFALLFTISFVIVFGLKVFLIFLGIKIYNPFKKTKSAPVTPPLDEKPTPKPKRKRPTGKTIIINPDDVSRIYVKRD